MPLSAAEKAAIESRLQKAFKKSSSVWGKVKWGLPILVLIFLYLSDIFPHVGIFAFIGLALMIGIFLYQEYFSGEKEIDREYGNRILAPVVMDHFPKAYVFCKKPKANTSSGSGGLTTFSNSVLERKGGIEDDFFRTGLIPYGDETQRSIYIRNGSPWDKDFFIYMNVVWFGSDGDSYGEINRGVVLRIREDQEIPDAVTIHTGRVGKVKMSWAGGVSYEFDLAPNKVETGNEVFDKTFTVHAMNTHDVFLILTPDRMERLLALRQKLGPIDISWHSSFIDVRLPASYAVFRLPDQDRQDDIYHISFSAAEGNVENLITWMGALKKDLSI